MFAQLSGFSSWRLAHTARIARTESTVVIQIKTRTNHTRPRFGGEGSPCRSCDACDRTEASSPPAGWTSVAAPSGAGGSAATGCAATDRATAWSFDSSTLALDRFDGGSGPGAVDGRVFGAVD